MRTHFLCALFLSVCLSAAAQAGPSQKPQSQPGAGTVKDAPWPTGELTERQLGDAIESHVMNAAKRDEFSGVFAAFREDSDLYQHAFGVADEQGTPIRSNTRFMLGSMSEMLTSVAIAQLVQEGKLHFEDTIAKALPGFSRTTASRTTVQELLTHTSGLPDYILSGSLLQGHKGFVEPAKYRQTGGKALTSVPDKTWRRSKQDYVLAAMIVQGVSGEKFEDYIRDHIFRAAHMKDSGFAAAKEPVPNLATGYSKGTGEGPRSKRPRSPAPRTEDGVYSTVLDLFRFGRALRTHVFLNAELTEKITSGMVDTPDGSKYGYGFLVQGEGPERVIAQRGEMPGGNSDLEMSADGMNTVVVLSNYDPPAASRLASSVMEFLLKQ